MSYDFEHDRMVSESTAKKIKRQISYYLKMLRGRHKRLLGGLAGVPITAELAEADTYLEWMATHPLYPESLRNQIFDMKRELVEPFEDLYFDSPISIDDILYGKTRPTQLEVLGSQVSEEEQEEIDKLEAGENTDEDNST